MRLSPLLPSAALGLGLALLAGADLPCFVLLRWAARHEQAALLLWFPLAALAGGVGVKLLAGAELRGRPRSPAPPPP